MRVLAAGFLVPLVVMAAFSFVVDPEGGHEDWSDPRFHEYREIGNRRGRARLLLEEDFDAVVIGSSRVSIGMDTDAVSLVDGRTANAGLMDTNLWELLKVTDFVLERTRIHTIALCIDLHALAVARRSNGDFERSEFAPHATWNRLTAFESEAAEILSWRSICAGVECLERLLDGTPRFAPDGVDLRRPPPNYRDRENARDHLLRIYLSNPETLLGFQFGEDRLRELENVLERAAAKDVSVVLAIPPVHALQLECMLQIGLWPEFVRMKRELTAIGARHRVPVIDFAWHHDYASEPLPQDDHPELAMRWWIDTSHSTRELGSLVLRRIAAVLGRDEHDGQSFGVELTPEGLESHLAGCDRARDQWRARNGAETAWVREVVHSRDLLWMTPPSVRRTSLVQKPH